MFSSVCLWVSTQIILSPSLPPYMVNFFKYPCIISNDKIRETFGFAPSVALEDALRSTRG